MPREGIALPRLTAVLLATFLGACGAAQQQTELQTKALEAQLVQLRDASEAQHRRMVAMGDRIALLEDQLEAQLLHGPRGMAAIPPGLKTFRLRRDAQAQRREAPSRPVSSITQSDMDALESRRAPARGGPRTAVPPPANAAGAGNIGVMALPAPGARPAPPPAAAMVKRPEPAVVGAMGVFRSAESKRGAGDLAGAIRAYTEFVRLYPAHGKADDALLGLGKCRYDRAEFAAAEKAFKRIVTDHSSGNRVADALLMVGLTQRKRGRLAESRGTLSRLASMYPKHPAGQRAAAEIQARPR